MRAEAKEKPRYAVVAAVQLPNVSDIEFESSLAELRDLAKTLGYEISATFTQKRASFDAGAYLGSGKREEIRAFVDSEPAPGSFEPGRHAAADTEAGRIEAILVDHEISPSQARNLEKEVGCEVMDRTMVILEIFHRHATSRAARAQVEIARLGYMAPRLREMAKLAGPQGRQRSGTGGRGAGESHTEMDRRKIRDRIAELQQEIDAMDVERKTQRARRQDRQNLSTVALVGYTNAGKSTLMRALTGSDVLVENKLFATLDTTVRALQPESRPRVLVSDTVGFERQLDVTDRVLAEIGAQEVVRIRVFNKIDHVGDAAAQAGREAELRAAFPGCIVMSARRAGDVAQLRAAIVEFFQQGQVEAELFLPWSAQAQRNRIFANCEVLEERSDEHGAVLRVRGASETVKAWSEQFARA
jgi:GTP-binding protein HflX